MRELGSRDDDEEPWYPLMDEEPVAETDAHVEELAALRAALEWHYRDAPDVYVAGKSLIYYGPDSRAAFAPDVYVVRGVAKRRRRAYKMWEEGRAPCCVISISSEESWLDDVGNTQALCTFLRVPEYFVYDPEAEVLKPPLQGFRLEGSDYERLPTGSGGTVESRTLGLVFWLDGQRRLHVSDASSGEAVLRPDEAYAALEGVKRERDEARRALSDVQSEVVRLHAELARLKR